MIDLLRETLSKEIGEKKELSEELFFSFNEEINDKVCINLDLLKNKKLTIECRKNCHINFFEIGENNSNIHYIIGEDSEIKMTLFSSSKGANKVYTFDLSNSANLTCAYADFCFGDENFEVNINLKGENSKAIWRLATLASNDDKKRISVSFNHEDINTYSEMNNYGVSKDDSEIRFLGTSTIKNKAKKSAAHQNARIMVFDERCRAEADPVLCIDENDVEASHASVVGKINEDHVFYLCSRGLSESEAKKLITLGYLNPIIEFFDDENSKNNIAIAIEKKV